MGKQSANLQRLAIGFQRLILFARSAVNTCNVVVTVCKLDLGVGIRRDFLTQVFAECDTLGISAFGGGCFSVCCLDPSELEKGLRHLSSDFSVLSIPVNLNITLQLS